VANPRHLSFSFSGGEVTPEFWGQVQDGKYQSGAATMRNFIAAAHGPALNRGGTKYVNTVKKPTKKTRLIPFTYSTTQTMVIELGDLYIRFHTQGATLLNVSVPYEVDSPYLEADLFDIHFVQSGDVLTLVHPNYPPAELRRLSAVVWTLTNIVFTSTLAAPAVPTVVATVGVGTTGYQYVVTSQNATGLEESVSSGSTAVLNNLLTTGNYNTISWTAVAGASRYAVYKYNNGQFGLIANTTGLTVDDANIAPDMSKTTLIASNPFNAANLYPGAVSYHEQRRCFAGSINEPQTLRMTRSGTESNLNYSIPTRDDDSINFKVAAREANTIRHIVPLQDLVLMTGGAEWRVRAINSDALTPTSVNVKPQSYVGCNNTQPVIVNNNCLFAAAEGGHLRELNYQFQAGGYVAGDVCLRATHLFDELDLVDLAFAKSPMPIVWAVSSSGNLLGLTYVPEQNVGAWHRHDTALGVFESCCVVAENKRSVLYVVTRRTINGAQTRYVERFEPRVFATPADAFFVDAGATYSGAPATVISGLSWLEGCTVNVLGDGAVMSQRVVVGGSITLERACSKVQVGLPITADLYTLPLALQIDGAMGQGRLKNVSQVWMRVTSSSGILAGPDANNLTPFAQRTAEPYGSPPSLRTDEIDLVIEGAWASGGQVFIRQAAPLPLTIESITVEVAVGG
jgi:hypothetical protein